MRRAKVRVDGLLIVKALVQKEVPWHLEILMEAEDAIALFLVRAESQLQSRASRLRRNCAVISATITISASLTIFLYPSALSPNRGTVSVLVGTLSRCRRYSQAARVMSSPKFATNQMHVAPDEPYLARSGSRVTPAGLRRTMAADFDPDDVVATAAYASGS